MKSLRLSSPWIVPLSLLVSLLSPSPALAQQQTGNLCGTVLDDRGLPVAGVAVTLAGEGAPLVQTSDELGLFRFLNLSPGSYRLSAALAGYSPFEHTGITVSVGQNARVEVTLTRAVAEAITVTTEPPLLDERRFTPSTTANRQALEKIPSTRDPFGVLQQTPGVLLDRIDLGGNASGSQAQIAGPGAPGDQTVWNVDGVNITDFAATGSAPTYFDFDSFEEVQVTTGGADASLPSGGVVLNMVTRRGSNQWRGSLRALASSGDWQSGTDLDQDKLGQAGAWNRNYAQAELRRGNRIDRVAEYGVEGGGPIVRDRLWLWGAWSDRETDLLTVADFSDSSDIETYNAKLNGQLTAQNSATLFWLHGERVERGGNAGPTRPQETTWNQDGPTDLYKLEDTHIFGSSFYLTGLASSTGSGFTFTPQGGLDVNASLDESFIWHNTFVLYDTDRPQRQYKVDGSKFFETGSRIAHELKFGAGYREVEVTSLSRWPGSGSQLDYYVPLGYPYNVVGIARDSVQAFDAETRSLYVQDTLTLGSLTANLGLRYDLQEGENRPASVPANRVFPEIVPALGYEGGDIGFDWESITPRLGLTWALGEERKTLLRGSYARFANQLEYSAASWLNPLYPGATVYYYYQDLDGDGQAEPGELLGPSFTNQTFNPLDPAQQLQSRQLDPGLSPPMTEELLFAVERSLRPDLVLGLALTYRRLYDLLEAERLVFDGDANSPENLASVGRLHRREDYEPFLVQGVLPNGEPWQRTVYRLRPGINSRGGSFLENGDREQVYEGASLSFNKRLANRWMAYGHFTVQSWEWDIPESEIEDPTRYLGGGNYDGAPVLHGSGTGNGLRGGVYLSSRWTYNLSGLYQVAPERRWGFNVGLNVFGREGYPIPYFVRSVQRGVPGSASTEAVDADRFRHEDVHLVNARLEKELVFDHFGLTLGVEIFNLFNEAYVLQRQHRLNVGRSATNPTAPGSDHVTEVTNPRVFRLGVRMSLR